MTITTEKTILRTLKDTVSRADRCDFGRREGFCICAKGVAKIITHQYCLFYNKS